MKSTNSALSIGERIVSARDRAGFNQSELARRLNISPQSIQQWEKGKTTPKSGRLKNLSLALGVSQAWLIGGGDNVRDYVPPTAMRGVPLVNYVQAGHWSESTEGAKEADLVSCPVPCSHGTFALEVVGESMEPVYMAGDVLFVDPNVEAINNDDVIAYLEDEEQATFKRLVLEPGSKRLKALNPEWAPRYAEINGNCRIVGTVIYLGRDPKRHK